MFCRSLFVLLYFFFRPLCCLFFFDIRILTTSLVSSNSSYLLCEILYGLHEKQQNKHTYQNSIGNRKIGRVFCRSGFMFKILVILCYCVTKFMLVRLEEARLFWGFFVFFVLGLPRLELDCFLYLTFYFVSKWPKVNRFQI